MCCVTLQNVLLTSNFMSPALLILALTDCINILILALTDCINILSKESRFRRDKVQPDSVDAVS